MSAFGITRTTYDVKVSHYAGANSVERCVISMSEEEGKKFEGKYIQLREGEDVVYFDIYDKKPAGGIGKGGHGLCLYRDGKVQFARADDLILLLDYSGEFPLRRTMTGMYYIQKSEKTGYTEIHSPGYRTSKKATKPTPVIVANTKQEIGIAKPVYKDASGSLVTMLEAAVQSRRDAWHELRDKATELEKQLEEIDSKQEKIMSEIKAFQTAIDAAKGVDNDAGQSN